MLASAKISVKYYLAISYQHSSHQLSAISRQLKSSSCRYWFWLTTAYWLLKQINTWTLFDKNRHLKVKKYMYQRFIINNQLKLLIATNQSLIVWSVVCGLLSVICTLYSVLYLVKKLLSLKGFCISRYYIQQ